MTQKYYACDWIIRPATHYELLLETAKKLGGQLVRLKVNQETAEGFIFNILAIRVSSENVLSEFVETAGRDAGMSDWYPISAADFAQGKPFPEPQEGYDLHTYLKWLDGMYALGKTNDDLLKRRN